MANIAQISESGTSTIRRESRITAIVISLPTAVSRREVVEQYLSRLNVPWRFFDAERFRSGSLNSKIGIEISETLSDGEVGCFLSHLSVWNEIRDLDVDYAIVLEDDTILIPAMDYYSLFELLRDLSIEFIRLTATRIVRAPTLAYFGPLYGWMCRITHPKYGIGTAAYAITPRTAGVLCDAVSKIDTPVDLWLERYGNHRVPIYNLFPAPAIEMRSQTTILSRGPDQSSVGILDYAIKRIRLAFVDVLDEWSLLKLDNVLRKRIDRLHPGMAVWPHSELRRHLRKLLPPWNSINL